MKSHVTLIIIIIIFIQVSGQNKGPLTREKSSISVQTRQRISSKQEKSQSSWSG